MSFKKLLAFNVCNNYRPQADFDNLGRNDNSQGNLQYEKTYLLISVSLQINALDRKCSSQTVVWYTAGAGLGQSADADITWSFSRIWQCWPQRITEAAAYVIWSWRTGDQLVRFIPPWPCSTCPSAYRRPSPHHLWFCTEYRKDQ